MEERESCYKIETPQKAAIIAIGRIPEHKTYRRPICKYYIVKSHKSSHANTN
jgi:hypothetical protein